MVVISNTRRQGTSKKTGKEFDAYIIRGISRGFAGPELSEFWIEPTCPGVSEIQPGDQIRVSQEGRAHYITNLNESCRDELDLLLSRMM